jgi:hypothetical protein
VALSQTVEGLYSGIVHREKAAEDDGNTGSYSFCCMRESGTTGGALSSLPPFFASFRKEGGRCMPISRQQISGAVKKAVNLVQRDSVSFSGISMRRGGSRRRSVQG